MSGSEKQEKIAGSKGGKKEGKKVGALGLVFLGLGSAIGGSFFLASGIAVRLAGPSVVLGYLFGGVTVYLIMVSLGHLALKYKERESFRGYVQEAVGPTTGFMVGWSTWLTNLISMVAESIAMAIYTRIWLPQIPVWMLPLAYGVLATGINFLGIKIVDKSEGFLTVIKTGALVAFMGVVAYIFLVPHRVAAAAGTANLAPFFPHGAGGLGQAMVICTFAYATGALASAMGDTKNPRRDIPRATIGMALGQAFFFTLPTLALVLAVPWTMVSTKASPFVTALNHVGIHAGGTILNAIVLISSFSVLVASMFSAEIMLSSLAKDKEAPAFLAREWKKLSIWALLVSSGALLLVSQLALLLPKHVYNYAVTTTGYLSFVGWAGILIARLALCLPQKNNGRMEWSGFLVAAAGLAALVLISILGLKVPEQRFSFVFTVVSVVVLLGIGKLVKKERETKGGPDGGDPQYAFTGKTAGPSLPERITGKLRQK
ncbi:amino acid permease [Desulfotomaculum copahuensis]|uniref:Amino acid permease/ SLC12A domain-containing protein n=1 Tax=Desulfotomaculum copahuensis TaxID=1838280 RepID=A0A1B7LAI8_9FIRM|nr:amino acid permease [Desulfotomaculum copahuensis]OAT79337.1 hypothetical protein A6M21_15910 [Desulfotomaculum copahuensis]